MAIQIGGFSNVVAEVNGTVFRALCVTARPVDYGALGAYRMHLLTGTMAAGLAAAAEIFQARWTDATRLAVVTELQLDGLSGSATAFAAGFGVVNAAVARGWSADGSGGTAATITGNNNKLRTSMGTTLMGAIRASSTAALTAGTKTIDSQSLGAVSLSFGTVVSVQYANQVPLMGPPQVMPVVLTTNEGVVVRATVPGTGTWQAGVTMGWSEVTAY